MAVPFKYMKKPKPLRHPGHAHLYIANIYYLYIGYIMEKRMFDELREFLINEEFPKELDKKQRGTFRRRASNFSIDGRPKVDI